MKGKDIMPTHRKTPIFIRVTASNKQVIGINPLNLSSFNIVEKAKFKIRKDPNDRTATEEHVADTVYFYFPSGTGLTYRAGYDISQADFDYICATLVEFMYLNENEFKAKSEAIKKAQMDDWNKLSTENEANLDTTKTIPKEV